MNRKERNDLAALDVVGIELFCPKCEARLGRVVDGVYLVIENVRFWHESKFTCKCGKPIRFKPDEPKDLHTLKDAQGILNGLGRDRKLRGN